MLVCLKIPLVDRDHHSAALAFGQVGNAQILLFKRNLGIQQHNNDFGEFYRPQAVTDAEFFQLFLNFRFFAHTGGVKDPHRYVIPDSTQGNRVTGDASFGAGQQTVLSHDLIDQRRLTRVRPTDNSHLQRLGIGWDRHRRVFVPQFGFLFGQIHICVGLISLGTLGEAVGDRHELQIKIVQPFAVFRGQADRLSQTEVISLDHTGIRSFAFGFVRRKNNMRRFLAQNVGKDQIRGGHPHACIDHEQTDVCHIHRAFGQTAHPALKAVIRHFFQPCGVNNGETQIRQPRSAFAQVACHTGLIINQSQLFADKAVE